jgi:hypothetical protein
MLSLVRIRLTDMGKSRTMAPFNTFVDFLAENIKVTKVELLYSNEPLNVVIRGFHIEILTKCGVFASDFTQGRIKSDINKI